MTSLEGKTIPIKGPDGKTRFVKVKGVGQPGWTKLPGGVKIYRQAKWVHPGIKPSRFMERSLFDAASSMKDEFRAEAKQLLGLRSVNADPE